MLLLLCMQKSNQLKLIANPIIFNQTKKLYVHVKKHEKAITKSQRISEIKSYIQVYAANCIQNAHLNYATSKGNQKLKKEKKNISTYLCMYGYSIYEYRHNLAK